MTIKFLKNEIIKIMHSKKIYILLSFVIFMVLAISYIMYSEKNNIINNVPRTLKYSEQFKMEVLHMNSTIFLKQYSIEFVFRTVVPYFIFFIIAFSVEIFGEDFFSGNMKYFARLDKNTDSIFKAKVLSLIVYSFLIVVINIILGFVISSFIFGVSFYGLARVIFIYSSAVIPAASFGLIIGIISMFIKNRTVSLTLGIVFSIFLTITDRLAITSKFSPIGILGIMDKARIENITAKTLIIANITSCIYLVVAYFIGKRIFKTKEFYY
ncbi:hypothetical protein [Clostridium aciditolerans]|uniref:Uncharacterized protein n=1 Tax=Clostridium aciditolerans TaxID=339861 RepID=A0A934I1N9_9CLOT|nr:hypothetical protein [Clostridium aciditolerans]MBI6874472.1 hypothetical protein [Clostridium aciditolerans]